MSSTGAPVMVAASVAVADAAEHRTRLLSVLNGRSGPLQLEFSEEAGTAPTTVSLQLLLSAAKSLRNRGDSVGFGPRARQVLAEHDIREDMA